MKDNGKNINLRKNEHQYLRNSISVDQAILFTRLGRDIYKTGAIDHLVSENDSTNMNSGHLGVNPEVKYNTGMN